MLLCGNIPRYISTFVTLPRRLTKTNLSLFTMTAHLRTRMSWLGKPIWNRVLSSIEHVNVNFHQDFDLNHTYSIFKICFNIICSKYECNSTRLKFQKCVKCFLSDICISITLSFLHYLLSQWKRSSSRDFWCYLITWTSYLYIMLQAK